MLRQTITFDDFNGESQTEDFYFNLSKAEVAKLELLYADKGGLEMFTNRVIAATDGRAAVVALDDIINMAYGERSPDGKRFMKSPEITANFRSTGAYDELIVKLVTDPTYASDFMSSILPAKETLQKESGIKTQTARERSEAQMQGFKQKAAPTVTTRDEADIAKMNAEPVTGRVVPSVEDFAKMTPEEFAAYQASIPKPEL